MYNISVAKLWRSAKLREKLIIIIGLVYILAPIDFVPEIILGPLGLLDDGGALLAIIYTVLGVINRQKHSRGNVVEGEEAKR